MEAKYPHQLAVRHKSRHHAIHERNALGRITGNPLGWMHGNKKLGWQIELPGGVMTRTLHRTQHDALWELIRIYQKGLPE